MMRRSLGAALWSLAGLLACLLGALSALVGTGAGRELLARVTETSMARVVHGSIEVGDVGGTLLTSVVLTDVRMFDGDSTLVAWLPRAELNYNPLDLAAGRVVLLALELHRPFVNLVQDAEGRLNLKKMLRAGRPSDGPAGPPPFVLFRNVSVTDGRLMIQQRDEASPDDSTHETVELANGERRRVRRFDRLDARLNAVRLSSPREPGVQLDIRRLAVASTDPPFHVTDARGRVVIAGDSIELDLERLRLPGSDLAARGRVRWPRDTVLYDLDLVVDSATLTDFRLVDHRFPVGAVLRGELAIRSRGGRLLEVRLDPLDVAYRGGAVSGRATTISASGEGLVALRQVDLSSTELDLELVRPFLDSLPFAGRLSGRTVADGRTDALGLQIDWVFRDSLVEGWPVTRVRGRGEVDLRNPEGLAFRAFAVDLGEVDLATVRQLIPAFLLHGTLDANGVVDGPYRNARFSGALRHHHTGPTSSLIRGMLRFDSRSDTLGVFGEVFADSLAFEELRGSFPELPLVGTVSGPVRVAGRIDRLDTQFDLAAPGAGRVRGEGVLTWLDTRRAWRDFTLRADEVDLARWVAGAPPSRLSLRLEGSVGADSGAAPEGHATVRLAPSVFAGAVLDSGAAAAQFTGGRLVLDSLRITQPGAVATGQGELSWTRPTSGALTLEFEVDTLAAVDSLLGWAAGRTGAPPDLLGDRLRGAAHVTVRLTGALDSLDIDARATGTDLAWRDWTVTRGDGRLRWHTGAARAFEVDVVLDSLAHRELGFGAVSAELRGTLDSLAWFARSRLGPVSAFLAGGAYQRHTGAAGPVAHALRVDSLAVLLPGGVWFLEHPAALFLGDSAASVHGFVLANAAGPGRVTVEGDLPTRGPGNASVQLEGFPVAGLYALRQRDTLGVGGSLTATLNVSGPRAAPVYQGSFSLSNGSFGQFRTPFVDGTVNYAGRRLNGSLNLWRAGQPILSVSAHLPLDLALQEVPRRQLSDTLSVRARADSVDLSLLEALTPLVRQVRGALTADLGIRGTWNAPSLNGVIRIVDAGAFIPAVNVRYEGISGRFRHSGDTIRVDSLTVRGGQGRADVSGTVRLEALTRPILDLRIEAQDFRALDLRNFLTITASGRLALTGPVFGAELTGRGTVTSGVWYFADLVRKRVVNIDAPWAATLIDTTLAATIRRQRLSPEFQSVFLDSLRIRDLDLAMGNDVWLRSNEANIQLTGTARASKQGADYVLTGTLQAPRGVYRLTIGPVTRDFTVTRGTVRYFGTPDLNAELDIEARHVVHPVATGATRGEDVPVLAQIGGTLLVPRLTLRSEGRELAQTEIISYLLFGQEQVDLGGDQAGSQQALVSSTLASVYGELERTIVSDLGVPLDYVEIRPIDPARPWQGTRFAAGLQVGEKTFLVLKAGFCGNQALAVSNAIGASFQFRISPEWRAEAGVEPGGCAVSGGSSVTRQVGLDLFWERRY